MMYADDNNEKVVRFNTYGLDPSNWRTDTRYVLVTVPASYSAEETVIYKVRMGYKQPSPMFEGPLFRYAPQPDIMHCPGDLRFKRPVGSGFAWDSYSGVNGLNGEGGSFMLKSTELKHPSERFLWAEGGDGRGENLGSWIMNQAGTAATGFAGSTWIDSPAAFHGSSSSFNWADGHCSMRKWLNPATVRYAQSMDQGKYGNSPSAAEVKDDAPWAAKGFATAINR